MTFRGGLRPLQVEEAARRGADRDKVEAIAEAYSLPAYELADRLDAWLWTWAHWLGTQGRRQAARDVLNKRAARAKGRGDEDTARAAEAALARPSARFPELTVRLQSFWIEHKGEVPSPGGGSDKALPNGFIRFCNDCAEAVGLKVEPPALRDRHQRWRKRVMKILEKRCQAGPG